MGQAVTNIRGIGAHAASVLSEHGFNSVEDLAKAAPEAVMAVKGFGSIRAKQLIAAAVDLLKAPAAKPDGSGEAATAAAAAKTESGAKASGDKAASATAAGKAKKKKDEKKAAKKSKKKKNSKKGKKKDKKGSGKKGKKNKKKKNKK